MREDDTRPGRAQPGPGHEGSPSALSAGSRPPPARAQAAARRRDRVPLWIVLTVCLVLLLVIMTLGVAIGSVPVSPDRVWHVVIAGIAGHAPGTVAGIIIWQIRLPRVLLAAVVGAALTTCG